ncbi:T9SS type A sorting domain-containing protein [Flavobacterium sp. RHBU_24]|uniref:T9SS type A sorting domain-containing protein n=1 Tax=Flavobacterium sp. RHBU_24 TaxID=3391185 RepID=UPI00398548F7
MKKALPALLFISSIFLAHAQQEPALLWTKRTGSNFNDEVAALSTDAAGNLYAAGRVSLAVDLDPGAGEHVVDGGPGGAFVNRYNADGSLSWGGIFKCSVTNSGSNITGMDVDAAGNVYSCGHFNGICDFNPGAGTYNISTAITPIMLTDFFITKLDSNGNFLWAKAIQGTSPLIEKSVAGICADNAGNIYITGFYSGVVDFDPDAGIANSEPVGTWDAYVAKYDTNGNFLWVKSYGTAAKTAMGTSLVSDGENVYAAGVFGGVVDFDAGSGVHNLTAHGIYSDLYILKLTGSGDFAWAKNIGNDFNSGVNAITLDNGGNILATGYFSDPTDFDPGTGVYELPSAEGTNLFVLKLDNNGNFIWARTALGGSIEGRDVDADANGNVFVTGRFNTSSDFSSEGTSPMQSFGEQDVVLAKLDSGGSMVWQKQMGSTGVEDDLFVAAGSGENVFAAGVFQDTVHFVPGTAADDLTFLGGTDFFIARYGFPETSGTAATIKETVVVYPNPSSGELFINTPDSLLGANATVYTLLGQRMAQFNLRSKTTQQTFARGFYMLEVNNGREKQTVKFVVE